MINVYPIKGGYSQGFIVAGHAESGAHGEDLVCAAVSALTQTTVLGLQMFTSIKKEVKEGFMLVEVLKIDVASDVLIETMVAGLSQIAVEYKENVTVWRNEIDEYDYTEDQRV